MWGVHLFDEASQAAERRTFRTNRRRTDRRQQRICLLQELFAPAVLQKDANFFLRLKESALLPEDCQTRKGNLLFDDPEYQDTNYHKDYPTIHHLICELMEHPEPHDVRLVYIACAFLLGHRGHFLRDIEPENVKELLDFSALYKALPTWFEEYGISEAFPQDHNIMQNVLRSSNGVTIRERELKDALYSGKDPHLKAALLTLRR